MTGKSFCPSAPSAVGNRSSCPLAVSHKTVEAINYTEVTFDMWCSVTYNIKTNDR